jgi:SAM-dependent methyltransferase
MTEALHSANRELDIFAHALNWKRYWSDAIRPFLRGSVLEVGAGIGSNTALLVPAGATRWLCLEPNSASAERIRGKVRRGALPGGCEVVTGTLAELPAGMAFDTVIYIDVLEHIEHDREELEQAVQRLHPQGHLIVLCPAHQRLYTAFDRAIGHLRRYSRKQLVGLHPPGTRLRKAWYLDSVGMALSLGNRVLLKQEMPVLRQIQFWDRAVIPLSRCLDPLLGHRLGKTVIAVWQKL